MILFYLKMNTVCPKSQKIFAFIAIKKKLLEGSSDQGAKLKTLAAS